MKNQSLKFKVQNSNPPSPSPSPARGEGSNISPPLRGGDEGEGDVCGFTNDRISKRGCRRQGHYFKGRMEGFTLIELVITMVLIGIIAYIVATALSTGIKAYFTTDFRKESLDQARIAMERMTREIRNLRDSDDVATGTSSQFNFTDVSGTNIDFSYSNPNITRNGSTLATNITSFSFSYIRADGTIEPTLLFVDSDPDNPATDTKRIRITLTATKNTESVTLQSEVWPRNL